MADREYKVVYKAVADFADLIKQSKIAQERVEAMSAAQEGGSSKKSLRDLDNYTEAVQEVGKAAADSTDAVDDLTDARKRDAVGTKEQTRAQKDNSKAQRDNARAMVDRVRATKQMRDGLKGLSAFLDSNTESTKRNEEVNRKSNRTLVSLESGIESVGDSLAGFNDDLERNRRVTTDTDRSFGSFFRTLFAGKLNIRAFNDELTETDKRLRKVKGSGGGASGMLKTLGEGFRNFGAVVTGLGLPSLLAYFSGTLISAVYALGGALVVAVQGLSQLGPLAASAPGGLLAIAQAALGAKVAIGGLGTALKLYSKEQADAAPQTFAEALDEMGPSTRKATKAIAELTDKWKGIQKATSESFFSQFVGQLKQAKGLLPVVRDLLGQGAESAGKFASQAIKMFTSAEWTKSLKQLSKSGATVVNDLGKALLFVVDGFRKIAVAARPLTEWLGGEFKGLAKNFTDWADNLGKGSFTTAQTRFTQFITIIKNLGSVIKSTFVAAGDTTDWFMRRFTEVSDGWASSMKKMSGQGGSLTKFFDELRPVMSETALLFEDLFRGLGQQVNMPGLAKMIESLRLELLPALLSIIDSWGQVESGQVFVDVVSNLAKLFATFSAAGFENAFILLFGAIGDLIGAIDFLLNLPVIKQFLELAGAVFQVVGPVLLLLKLFKLMQIAHAVQIALSTKLAAAAGMEAAALGAAGTSTSFFAAALGRAATAAKLLLSPLGLLALAIVGTGVFVFNKLMEESARVMRTGATTADELTKALKATKTAFVDQGADVKRPWWVGGTLGEDMQSSFKELAKFYGDTSLRDNISNFWSEAAKDTGSAELYEEQLKNITTAITELAKTDPKEAARQLAILENTLRSTGKSDTYIESVIGPLRELVDGMGDAAGATDKLSAAQDRLAGIFDKAQGKLAEQGAWDRFKKSLADVDQALIENGRTLDSNTEAGQANRAALREVAESAVDSYKASGYNNRALEIGRKKYIEMNIEMGKTPAAARKAAAEVGLVPKKAREAAEEARKNIKSEIQSTIDEVVAIVNGLDLRIKAGVDVTIRGDYKNIPGAPTYPGSNKRVISAAGGYIRGPGTTTSDDIPALLSDREFVVQAAAVDKYGVPFFTALNAMRFSDGGAVGLKKGGIPKASGSMKNMVVMPRDVKQGVADRKKTFTDAKRAAADNPDELRKARESLRDAEQDLADATDEEAIKLRKDEAAAKVRDSQQELEDANYDLANGVSVRAAELDRDKALAEMQAAEDDYTKSISVGRAQVELDQAKEDAADALEDYEKGISVGRAQLELDQAQEDAADALEDYEKGISVGAATVGLHQAQEEYRQALLDASTGLSTRSAQADLQGAEEAYRKVMTSATASQAEKAQARIALEEARNKVTETEIQTQLRLESAAQDQLEAEDNLGDTTAQVALRVQETSQRRLEAEDNLGDVTAQVALRVQETKQRQLEADQNLIDTTKEVALRREETKQSWEQADHNVSVVTREVADRVADAGIATTTALKEQRELPRIIQEEISDARYAVKDAKQGVKETRWQNAEDQAAWKQQMRQYGKTEAAPATKKTYKAYTKTLDKGDKATKKGYGQYLKKNPVMSKDKQGNPGVFDTGRAYQDAWKEYKEAQKADKQTFDDVNSAVAPTERMGELADYMQGLVGKDAGASNACLKNVRLAVDEYFAVNSGSAAYAGTAKSAKDMLAQQGLLKHGDPPRGAVVFGMGNNPAGHVAISDGKGNMLNTWSGSTYQKLPLKTMHVYGWVYPSELGGGKAPGKRVGGRVSANSPYTVGEAGQELFVPDVNGRIITAAQTTRLLAGLEHQAKFGMTLGLPGMMPGLPNMPVGSSDPAALERANGAVSSLTIGGITVNNPVPERASDSIHRRVKMLTNRMP